MRYLLVLAEKKVQNVKLKKVGTDDDQEAKSWASIFWNFSCRIGKAESEVIFVCMEFITYNH